MTNGIAKKIRIDFERVVGSYEDALCELFQLNKDDGFWVGDDIGGVYCNGDMFCITFDEMRIVIDNNISKKEFLEYEEYVSFCMEFNKVAPNLQSWIKGCPRHSKETIQKIHDLKRQFDIAVSNFNQEINKL